MQYNKYNDSHTQTHTYICTHLHAYTCNAIRAQMRCTNNTLIVYIDDVAHVYHNHSDRIRGALMVPE